jgi:hypothetical protein
MPFVRNFCVQRLARRQAVQVVRKGPAEWWREAVRPSAADVQV